jgi:hypothetical protein
MGLDQYGWACDHPITKDDYKADDYERDGNFYWRKHAKLHEFMIEIAQKNGTLRNSEDFNCDPLELSLEDILNLRTRVKEESLPESEGGMFWGHQFQDEQVTYYKDGDVTFCDWAEQQIKKGRHVYYDCWW